MFHKDTSQNIQELKHKFYIFLATVVKEYPYYLSLLENISLLKKENEGNTNTDIEFLNYCNIIQNLNIYELNSSLSSFLLLKDSIPQYKNIYFPKLDIKDNESVYNEKIKNIAILLEVIKSSLEMPESNIRFNLFKKYINDNNKLKAVNKVLSSLKIKQLKTLNEKEDLMHYVELQIENNKFLESENNNNLQTISNLRKEIKEHEDKNNNLNEISR